MIKKIKQLTQKLIKIIEDRTPGYLAHCQDCNRLERVIYLKDVQKFLCKNCIDRYTKLYVKMKERNGIGKIRQVV